MIEFWALALAAVALMRWMPDLPLARLLHRHMVEKPVVFLLSLSRVQVIKLALIAGLLLTMGDLVLMLGSADVLFVYAGELALYVDVVAMAILAASVTRVRTGVHWLALRFRPAKRSSRVNRRRRTRRKPTSVAPANDDDDRSGAALLAA